jgi:hypothetical protein
VSLYDSTLSSATTYDAISYVWGDVQSTVAILCDGQSLQITENLHWALQRLRLSDLPRVVWADAICIDQTNLKERSYQVSLMGRIYSGAKRVFACFGDADLKTASNLHSLIRQYQTAMSKGKTLSFGPSTTLWKDSRWSSLGDLTSRPWFTRAWVLQEIGLAKDARVLFGGVEVSYRDLIGLIRVLPLPLAAKYNVRSWLIHMEWTIWAASSTNSIFTFLDLLGHASFLNCKDPRDRVYAFLGHPLSRYSNDLPIIIPDYEKGANTVYLDTTAQLLRLEGLRVLTKVNNTEQSLLQDLPSWVVRWDACRITNRIYSDLRSPFKASAGVLQPSSDFIHGDRLKLTGVELDTVTKSYQTLLSARELYNFQDKDDGKVLSKSALLRYLNDMDTPYALQYRGTPRKDTFFRTISCSSDQNKGWVKDLKIAKALFWRNRAFLVTEKGLYGFGPDLVKPGDRCCVLFGIDVPMILRPCGQCFQILGESYIPELMDGQIKDMLAMGEVVEKQFDVV